MQQCMVHQAQSCPGCHVQVVLSFHVSLDLPSQQVISTQPTSASLSVSAHVAMRVVRPATTRLRVSVRFEAALKRLESAEEEGSVTQRKESSGRTYVRHSDRTLEKLTVEDAKQIDEFWSRKGVSKLQAKSKLLSLAQTRPLFRNVEELSEKVEFLRECLPGASVGRIVSRHPLLLERSPEVVLECLLDLSQILPDADMAKMVERQPTILLRRTATLQRNLQTLKELLPDCNVERMVERQPVLLFLDSRASGSIAKNILSLKNLFPSSDVYRMLEREPSLLYQNSERVVENFKLLSSALPGADTGKLLTVQPSLLYSDVRRRTAVNVERLERIFARIGRRCGIEDGVNFVELVTSGSGSSLLTTRPETTESKLERLQKFVPDDVLRQWLQRPSTLSRILNASHAVLDRIEYLSACRNCDTGFTSAVTMTTAKFCEKFPDFPEWQENKASKKED